MMMSSSECCLSTIVSQYISLVYKMRDSWGLLCKIFEIQGSLPIKVCVGTGSDVTHEECDELIKLDSSESLESVDRKPT